MMDNNTTYEGDLEHKEMAVLNFMEVTECETYEEAMLFVAMHGYNVKVPVLSYMKHAVSEYMQSKGNSQIVSQHAHHEHLSPALRKQSL